MCRLGSGLCDGLITCTEGVLPCLLVCARASNRVRNRYLNNKAAWASVVLFALQKVDRQYADDLILRGVRVTIFAMERQ